jgi:hypothetical protein
VNQEHWPTPASVGDISSLHLARLDGIKVQTPPPNDDDDDVTSLTPFQFGKLLTTQKNESCTIPKA